MKYVRNWLALFILFCTPVFAQNNTVANHAFAIGKGSNVSGYTSLLCGSGQLALGQAGADPICRNVSGDFSLSAAGVAALITVNSNVGTFGSSTNCVSITVDAKGRITAASQVACAAAAGGITQITGDVLAGPGSGVIAALLPTVNANVGSFGSTTQCTTFTVNAKGQVTAASAATCAPVIGSITGLAAGIATWLGTSSSANLRAALTDETGSGFLYFQNGDLGTPSAGVGTNLTALNAGQLSSGTIPPARTNGHMNGTATNDNAAAGEVGEYMSNSAGSVALSSGSTSNVGQLPLTAGDWVVSCSAIFSGVSTTVTTDIKLALNSTSATLPSSTPPQFFEFRNSAGITDFIYTPSVGQFRVSLAAPQTWYCVGQATFASGTFSVTGTAEAWRPR